MRSNWVHQEVGYWLKGNKPIIPLVEKGTNPKDLAALMGKEYVEYDPLYPEQALSDVTTYVKSLKLTKENTEKILLIAGGILALLLLISGAKK
jgi:hypothetical protein